MSQFQVSGIAGREAESTGELERVIQRMCGSGRIDFDGHVFQGRGERRALRFADQVLRFGSRNYIGDFEWPY